MSYNAQLARSGSGSEEVVLARRLLRMCSVRRPEGTPEVYYKGMGLGTSENALRQRPSKEANGELSHPIWRDLLNKFPVIPRARNDTPAAQLPRSVAKCRQESG
ncbi:hypothetical protein ACEPAG_1469 [Sanghuangporus baumii]